MSTNTIFYVHSLYYSIFHPNMNTSQLNSSRTIHLESYKSCTRLAWADTSPSEIIHFFLASYKSGWKCLAIYILGPFCDTTKTSAITLTINFGACYQVTVPFPFLFCFHSFVYTKSLNNKMFMRVKSYFALPFDCLLWKFRIKCDSNSPWIPIIFCLNWFM